MEHDRCPKGLAGRTRRLAAWRREMILRAAIFMAAIGYTVMIVALVHNAAWR